MVPKGKKAGETFADGGLRYKVLKVLPGGAYLARRIPQKAAPAKKGAQTP